MFSRVGSLAIKNGLTNIVALSNYLGNPHVKGRFLHVAGTNGKGSVSHMMASVLQAAGYNTGLYTSPHLKDLRERIKINGSMIQEQELVNIVEKLKPAIETLHPSFFEITVAMAFDHFVNRATDFSVIETGLGGRLDSTNIIQPEISIITNIGYDHVKILGDTLPEIAREKAGIIKDNGVVIIGESHPETEPIFWQVAKQRNAQLIFADKVRSVQGCETYDNHLVVAVKNHHNLELKQYTLDLAGSYQAKNLLSLLAAVDVLRKKGYPIDEEAVLHGLRFTRQTTSLQGRWQTLRTKPRVLLDVAHNPDGIRQVLQQLQSIQFDQLHFVLGMVRDKDVATVLSLLPKDAAYYFTEAQVPRALNKKELKTEAEKEGLRGAVFSNVNSALLNALQHSGKNDLILVCGSVFLVGEVDLELFTEEEL